MILDIADHKMFYSTYGKGDPILFIHGFGTSSFSWRHNIKPLSKYYKLYLIDLIGFGKSDKPTTPYSRSFFIKQIHQFIQKLKIKQPILIGASWGACLTMAFALKYPQKIHKLILINSLTPFYTNKLIKSRQKRFKMLWDLHEGKKSLNDGKKLLESLLKESFYKKNAVTEEVIREQFKMWQSTKGRNVLIKASQECQFDDLLSKNTHIDKEVLIIWGAKDPYFPLKSAHWLNNQLKRSTLTVVPAAGHAPHETHGKQVNDLILSFLKHCSDKIN